MLRERIKENFSIRIKNGLDAKGAMEKLVKYVRFGSLDRFMCGCGYNTFRQLS